MAAVRLSRALLLLLFLACSPATAFADEPGEDRARCNVHDPLRRPWFGDLHVHTRHSLDASTQGTRTTPEEAYRFARGEALGLHPFSARGEPSRSVRLARPLDFAAVTDHAELFGETHLCNTPGSAGYDSTVCVIYRGWPRLAFFFMNARGAPRFGFCGEDGRVCVEAGRGPWREMREAADAATDPTPACAFTAFVGYEWTKSVETASNLHRNVIFRSASVPEIPASAVDAPTPEDLWDALDVGCRDALPGCDAVVIPHNSNLSTGFMFAPDQLRSGAPFDRAYAERRLANEPLVEITQHKGNSECRLGAGTTDELCDDELLPYDSFLGRFFRFGDPAFSPLDTTRGALGAGLVHREALGANPFAFGVIGSTDTHVGTPGLVAERAYPGHGGAGKPLGESLPDALLDLIEYNPGGLAVLWAEENTRDSLFAAMRRREAYATSGPRIAFRVFGGWGLDDDLCDAGFASRGYAQGVPMGGELPPRPALASAPSFAAWAVRDPGTSEAPGVPLQRVQIVKLALVDGAVRETVVDIAGDAANGASVDPDTCEPEGAGADQLCRVWRDPDFDPDAPALYYARAVQNPTCRWSTFACRAADVRCDASGGVRPGWEACCDESFPKSVQERAWTSPIWYTP